MNLEWIESSLRFLLDIYKNQPIGLTESYAESLGTSYFTLVDRVKKWSDAGYLEKRRKPKKEFTLGGTKNLYSLTETGKTFLFTLTRQFQEHIGVLINDEIRTIEEVTRIVELYDKTRK